MVRYIDLFCGIGGFRAVGEQKGWDNVFSSDINPAARKAYEANWGELPSGDITKIAAEEIPAHDVLFAGFPCQPFSIAGAGMGFEDTRGTLFFDVARIIEHHMPSAFVLENVARLATHDHGRTLARILEVLRGLGYETDWKILNALDYGLPHNRTRIFIVGTLPGGAFAKGGWPTGGVPMRPLAELLEAHETVDRKFLASEHIKGNRRRDHATNTVPAIWHENKSGNITSHPYSCALRASASYNYLLVDGIRRLTSRELLRLQGFPESFKIVCSDGETRTQAGNSVAIPVVRAVVDRLGLVDASRLTGFAGELAAA